MSDRLAIGAALWDGALAATTADTHAIDAVACNTGTTKWLKKQTTDKKKKTLN